MAFEYRFRGQTVSLPIDSTLVGVRLREPAPREARAAQFAAMGVGAAQPRTELPGEKFTLVPTSAAPVHAVMAARAPLGAAGAAGQNVARVTPVFKVGNQRVLATDRIVVGFDESVSEEEAGLFLKRRGYDVVDEVDGSYVARLPETADPFEEIQKLDAIDKVAFAEPDFVRIGRHVARMPTTGVAPTHRVTDALKSARSEAPTTVKSDPYLDRQYALTLTQADKAWAEAGNALANSPILIAILDEGVDRAHEDLHLVAEYDATGNDLDQQPNSWDGHGTACAGLACAVGSNDKGVRGIAPGFGVLAIRIAFSSEPGGDWITTNANIGRGITWARRHGADVLSNSWGGGAPSTLIANAFDRARQVGRKGKGCVICIAAGNENTAIDFPGTLPEVLTVTASNEFDEPKTPTSNDGETWWGSSFGSDADVAAPGVHNYTTDISSSGGYGTGGTDSEGRPISPEYTPDFNGTSSATPIVAGAAALCLAVQPNLSEHQVRDILRTTADKVGATYDSKGFNTRMGYGRLNVHAAVKKAMMTAPSP